MILVSSNKAKQLLILRYVGLVQADELAQAEADIRALVAELPKGFRVLLDLSQLDDMDLKCAKPLGRMMDFFNASNMGLVVRVIPDPAKDIGLNILSIFHYSNHPRIVTCKKITEAAPHLG